MNTPPVKRCSVCRETKPLEEFGANRSRSDGRQHTCRTCRKAVKGPEWLPRGLRRAADAARDETDSGRKDERPGWHAGVDPDWEALK